MSSTDLYHLIERIANLLRNENRKTAVSFGLQPVHIEALSYLSRCNRYSDTPAAVTEFLGATKGTVSQSLQVLEKKGLIEKTRDLRDKRIQHLRITDGGKNVLSTMVPPPLFHEALLMVQDKTDHNLSDDLTVLLKSLQVSHGSRSFGACYSCAFFNSHEGLHQCGLTREPLSEEDSRQICREHEVQA